jgi:predicted SAM-dependent methyltransferase
MSVTGSTRDAVFLGVHRVLSRDWLYREATGVGLELGPGPVPQILSAENVAVSYVEQMPPDEWDRLYNANGRFPRRPELWSNYVVGDASRLPAADDSLDFLFSSHVFEHLANPIGHLEHWFRKLRGGGRVLCVIPDVAGTKDALQKPSSMDEWLGEYRQACWTPTPAHYARFFRQSPLSETVRKALQDRFSVHAHFYTNTNCEELLSFACDHLGYSSFDMEWTANTKDFHFILRKG